jgi:hypothetical protein
MKRTVWNLTDFSDLEEPVLSEYTPRPKCRLQKQSFLTQAMAVVAIATGLSVTSISAHSTAPDFTVPCLEAAAHSGLEQTPPLASLFADRFHDEWTEFAENALLAKVHDTSNAFTKAELEDQTIDSIYFNQHDEPSHSADRLSRDEIREVVRRKKLV